MVGFNRKFCFRPPVRRPLQNKNQRISVVVPVRNRADLLARCLDSLVSQSFSAGSFEIVVCDDGSAEDLSGVIERCRQKQSEIKIVKQDRLGPAAARNLGIRNSSSPIILFIDSDIVADRELLRHIDHAMTWNPNWIGAEACLIPVEGFQNPLWEAPDAPAGGRFHTAAIAYRREVLITAGGLDESFLLPACEDVELAARILPLGPIGFVPEAKAFHPRRKVNLRTHWRSRLQWKYLVTLAKRYGILAFPERKTGRFYRFRIAFAAIVALPLGRLLGALRWIKNDPSVAALAGGYALFDVVCGLWALPDILIGKVPERLNYLQTEACSSGQQMKNLLQECS
jgi:glycosyltransferase involved in cell wall biosynthesis